MKVKGSSVCGLEEVCRRGCKPQTKIGAWAQGIKGIEGTLWQVVIGLRRQVWARGKKYGLKEICMGKYGLETKGCTCTHPSWD